MKLGCLRSNQVAVVSVSVGCKARQVLNEWTAVRSWCVSVEARTRHTCETWACYECHPVDRGTSYTYCSCTVHMHTMHQLNARQQNTVIQNTPCCSVLTSDSYYSWHICLCLWPVMECKNTTLTRFSSVTLYHQANWNPLTAMWHTDATLITILWYRASSELMLSVMDTATMVSDKTYMVWTAQGCYAAV